MELWNIGEEQIEEEELEEMIEEPDLQFGPEFVREVKQFQ